MQIEIPLSNIDHSLSMLLFIVGALERFLPGPVGRIVGEMSSLTHFERFSRGVVDLRDVHPDLTGKQAEAWLEEADIIVNKNMIPFDERKPTQTSGLIIKPTC